MVAHFKVTRENKNLKILMKNFCQIITQNQVQQGGKWILAKYKIWKH